MADIVPSTPEEPFLFWLRDEWGVNGNPHVHGQCYVSKSPTFECVVESAEARTELIAHGHAEANKLQTRDEAEATLGSFFGDYVSEWHPAKDANGDALYPFVKDWLPQRAKDAERDALYPYVLDLLRQSDLAQPQCVDLVELLDGVFAEPAVGVHVEPLQRLLAALIEDGQRHSWHGEGPPTWGVHACARKGSASEGTTHVYTAATSFRDSCVCWALCRRLSLKTIRIDLA
jgi:hypothetical protein